MSTMPYATSVLAVALSLFHSFLASGTPNISNGDLECLSLDHIPLLEINQGRSNDDLYAADDLGITYTSLMGYVRRLNESLAVHLCLRRVADDLVSGTDGADDHIDGAEEGGRGVGRGQIQGFGWVGG